MGWRAPIGDQYDDWVERSTQRRFVVGMDCGQSHDPSALAVIEAIHRPDVVAGQRISDPDAVRSRTKILVRHLERLRLGQDYVDQAAYVLRLMQRRPICERCDLVVDGTGLGKPLIDVFRKSGLKPISIVLTGGQEASGGRYDKKIPKLLVVSRLQSLLHTNDLLISKDLSEATVLMEELRTFHVTFSPIGYAHFDAAPGKHDDLLIATALATWVAMDRGGRVVSSAVVGHH